MRDRSMALVVRDKKILMVKLYYYERFFYSLPGGGIEQGETPGEAAIRELKEECCVDGTLERKLVTINKADGSLEHVFAATIPDEQEPTLGYNPEEPADEQSLKEAVWMRLDELSEKDRAFLWSYGLLELAEFFEEAIRWGDEISYPGM